MITLRAGSNDRRKANRPLRWGRRLLRARNRTTAHSSQRKSNACGPRSLVFPTTFLLRRPLLLAAASGVPGSGSSSSSLLLCPSRLEDLPQGTHLDPGWVRRVVGENYMDRRRRRRRRWRRRRHRQRRLVNRHCFYWRVRVRSLTRERRPLQNGTRNEYGAL